MLPERLGGGNPRPIRFAARHDTARRAATARNPAGGTGRGDLAPRVAAEPTGSARRGRPGDVRTTIGFFPWRFVDGESCIGRCVAMVDDDEYEELAARKAALPVTRFGDCYEPKHVEQINRLTKRA